MAKQIVSCKVEVVFDDLSNIQARIREKVDLFGSIFKPQVNKPSEPLSEFITPVIDPDVRWRKIPGFPYFVSEDGFVKDYKGNFLRRYKDLDGSNFVVLKKSRNDLYPRSVSWLIAASTQPSHSQRQVISKIGGTRRSRARLTKEIVMAIKGDLAVQNYSQVELAAKYGISVSLISLIASNKRWADVQIIESQV